MNELSKYLCATLRLFDNTPYPKDMQELPTSLVYGTAGACVVFLTMKTESYIYQERNKT